MWPRKHHEDILGDEWLEGAAARLNLRTTKSASQSQGQKKLWERIFGRLEAGAVDDSACHSLCAAAIKWKDPELFFRAVKVGDVESRCAEFEILDEKEMIEAILAFGFQTLGSL